MSAEKPKAGAAWGVEFRQVSKRYGGAGSPLAVKGIDLRVPKGSLVTLLGPSGCGKTTTLRMIAGLESPSGGQILIDGEDVTTLGPSERPVSMVFQSYALFPHLSVIDNVCYGLKVSGVSKAEALQRARAALESVGLVGFDARSPSELSGGQQQRVAVARSLVLEPRVLLFDEPLSNLDARLRRSMREEIRALQQRLNLTVAYVTHDQAEALAVSDLIIVMEAGSIAQAGTPRDLYERPGSAFVAGFMGEALLFEAEALPEGRMRLGPLELPQPPTAAAGAPASSASSASLAAAGERLRVAVRPEAWHVVAAASSTGKADAPGSPKAPAATSPGGEAWLPGILIKHAYLGHSQELTVATDLGEIFVVSPDPRQRWEAGQPVQLRLASDRVSAVPDLVPGKTHSRST